MDSALTEVDVDEHHLRRRPRSASRPGQINAVALSSDGKASQRLVRESRARAPGLFADFMVDKIGIPTRYKFSVDYVFRDTARLANQRHRHGLQATVKPGIWPSQTTTQMHRLHRWHGAWPMADQSAQPSNPSRWSCARARASTTWWSTTATPTSSSLDNALEGIGSAIASKAIEVLSSLACWGAAAGAIIGYLGLVPFPGLRRPGGG